MLRWIKPLHRHVRSRRDFILLALLTKNTLRAFVLLKWMKLPAVLASRRHRQDSLSEQDIHKLADYATRLARRVAPNNPCLYRSAGLYRVLRQHGQPVTFHLGLQRCSALAPSALRGHAWLSRDGKPYLESESTSIEEFVVTFSYSD